MNGPSTTRRHWTACLITLWVLTALDASHAQSTTHETIGGYVDAVEAAALLQPLDEPSPAAARRDTAVDEPPGAAARFGLTVERDLERPLPADSPLAGVRPVTLDQAEHGALLLETELPGLYLPAPTLETDVLVRVTGIVVRTRIKQRFTNPTDWWVEGTYVFPLPEKAAVDRLRMRVGERVVEGQIQEKVEAERVYQQAKREGRKASLVSQQRPNVFTSAVANIGPQETIEVVIEYQNTARYDLGRFSLRLPMVVNPRYEPFGADPAIDGPPVEASCFEERLEERALVGLPPPGPPARPQVMTAGLGATHAIEPPTGSLPRNPVQLAIELHAGFPLAELDSPHHEILAIESSPGDYLVTLADPAAPADHDFELVWRPRTGSAPRSALFTEEHGGDVYALLMLLPPAPGQAAGVRLPRETVFVIDTSGSMHGASIDQAKRALLLALERLEPVDSFNVIQFNSATRQLFPSSVPAAPHSLEAARRWVAELESGGGTEMLPAFQAALGHDGFATPTATSITGLRQVIFITDGSVGNERQLFGYLERNLGRSRLFTVGIGSAPNSFFMREAARAGRGSFTYIGRVEEVDEKMTALFEKIDSPTMADLEVVWDDPGAESYPEVVPDLYAGEPLTVVARLGRVGSGVRISGLRAHAPWSEAFALPPALEQVGIEKLWAREKIARLMDGLHQGVDPDEVRAAVLAEALGHHLVSRYTSLVAVDLTPTRPLDAPAVSRKIPLELPAGWTPPAEMAGSLPRTATPAPLLLVLGLLSIGAALLLRRGTRREIAG